MKRIFTYEEASVLIPEVQRLTSSAVAEVEALATANASDDDATDEEAEDETLSAEYQRIVGGWAESIIELGIEVKGLWLIDFDNGSGYYCWRHPEAALQFFHGYEEGFGGRTPLC